MDEIYQSQFIDDFFTSTNSNRKSSAIDEALEKDCVWVDCDDFVPRNSPKLEDFTFVLKLRVLISSCLGGETSVLECSETLARKLTRLEARIVPLSIYIAFFVEILHLPGPGTVADPLFTKILAYILERLKRTEEDEDWAAFVAPLIDAAKFIFKNGKSSELATVTLKVLEYLKRLHPDLCALLYNYTLDLLEGGSEVENVISNFNLIISECFIYNYNPRGSSGFSESVQKHYKMAPVYRILTFKDQKEQRLNLLRSLPYNLENSDLLDSYLNSTGFLATLNLDRQAINERRQVFSELLHRCTPPMLVSELIFWVLERGFLNILEGILIYLNSMLHGLTAEEIYNLWTFVLVGPKADLNLAARLWAYVPPTFMSLDALDSLIVAWIDQNMEIIETRPERMKYFRLIILATDSLAGSLTNWPIPEKLKNYFSSEQELNKSLHSVIAEIVQVFLAKKAGLPFSLTELPEMPKESFTWEDVVDLINEYVDKFARINKY